MKKVILLLSLIACLLLWAPPDRSLAQMSGPLPSAEFQHQMQEQKRQLEQQQEAFRRRKEEDRRRSEETQAAVEKARAQYDDQAWQEALDATAAQWQALKPRLEKIAALKEMVGIDISIYGFAGGANYEGGAFVQGDDGSRSSAYSSGRVSATGQSHSDSRSSTRGQAGGSRGWSYVDGNVEFRAYIPGPTRKQVGDLNLGWQWQRPSFHKSPDQWSAGERVCEQLLDALETDRLDPGQVRRQIEALRQVREQKRTELAEARRQLRTLVTPAQEAKLVLMGYLD